MVLFLKKADTFDLRKYLCGCLRDVNYPSIHHELPAA